MEGNRQGWFQYPRPGKFERNWEVVVDENAALASHELDIPQNILENTEQKTQDLAKKAVLDKV